MNHTDTDPKTTRELETIYLHIIELLGEDPTRDGLVKTPHRVATAMQYLTRGYAKDPAAVLRSAMFKDEGYKQMVLVRDIDFYSLCEHHLLPFFGKAHVAYIPKEHITGLSKIPRVVDIFRWTLADSGTTHLTDKRLYTANSRSTWCHGRHRSPTHLHADAWRRKTEFHNHHLRLHRSLP